MNQVRRQINKLIEREQAPRLCQTVATRVARSGGVLKQMETVEIVTGIFRMSDLFAGNRAPLSETVRARCAVRRAS